LRQGRNPVPDRRGRTSKSGPAGTNTHGQLGEHVPARLTGDPAFESSPESRHLAAWFDHYHVNDCEPHELARAVPLSRIYVVSDEARKRARFWCDFSEALERRSGGWRDSSRPEEIGGGERSYLDYSSTSREKAN